MGIPRVLRISVAVWGCFLSYHAKSLSITGTGSVAVQPRHCTSGSEGIDCDHFYPTLSEIVSRIQDLEHDGRATPDTSACFLTGFAGRSDQLYEDILLWLEEFAFPSCYFADWPQRPVENAWYQEQTELIADRKIEFKDNNPEYPPAYEQFGLTIEEFFKWCYWQGLAAASLNPIAVLFAPESHTIVSTSIWTRVEFPALSNNPNVEKVYRVDPRAWLKGPYQGYSSPELIWQRGTDPPLSQSYPAFNCPVVPKPIIR